MRIVYSLALALPVTFLLLWLCHLGLQNKVDPLWTEIDSVMHVQDWKLLANSEEELKTLYQQVQRDPSLDTLEPIQLVSQPFMPTMEWTKFAGALNQLMEDKKVVISGATGSGKSTLIDRISQVVAVSPERIANLTCVEEMAVEYHKAWIGTYEGGKFYPGRLLDFFEKCRQDTLHNYILLIDDFDKIYRGTFFGAELWRELENPDYDNYIYGYDKEISIPDNFYMISVCHPGKAGTVPVTAEDLRRLSMGNPIHIRPNYHELLLYISQEKPGTDLDPEKQKNLQKALYFFIKTNQMIEEKFGPSVVLGQWSGLRKSLRDFDLERAKDLLIEHVNTYDVRFRLSKADFEPIDYTIKSGGLVRESNFFSLAVKETLLLGIFTEFSVAILFAIVSAIIGFLKYTNRKRRVNKLVQNLSASVDQYQSNKIRFDLAYGQLLNEKEQVQTLVKKRQINFSEANYLLLNLSEQLKQMEYVHSLGDISDKLKWMIKEILADKYMDEFEFKKRKEFLYTLRGKVDEANFMRLEKHLLDLYRKSLAMDKSKEAVVVGQI